MRLFLSLPVLGLILFMALEGPAPAQATPDFTSTLEGLPAKLKEFGSTLEDKARAAIEHIKQSDLPAKTRSWFSETLSKVREKFKATFS
ncbi:PREDICTED: apolipoprotein C-I [Chinchilla lanigera]|uniref:apolipoprotein C-I n=1 Tax=Chinchilla lanigera TaxID=34839 RepID=UPI0006968EA8|nr:PREDICTED: apolipoprotein C-I [Chinchilla lanigera]